MLSSDSMGLRLNWLKLAVKYFLPPVGSLDTKVWTFKSAYQKIIFLISQPKHMLWVLKRTVSMRLFF